jgi:hypothetical protein
MIPCGYIPVNPDTRATLVIREPEVDVFVVVRTKFTKDGRWYQYKVYPHGEANQYIYYDSPGVTASREYIKHSNIIK